MSTVTENGDLPIPTISNDDDHCPLPVSPKHKMATEGPRSCQTVSLLLITELIKWILIFGAIYLGVWRYCVITDINFVNGTATASTEENEDGTYYKCKFGDANSVGEFWGIFTGIMCGISLLVYLPWRLIAIKFRFKYYVFRDHRWRPCILFYILFGACPGFFLILGAYMTVETPVAHMGPVTVTALQMVILGLVFTEWTAKIQQEQMTYDLLTAMAVDFLFAYDVIAFVSVVSKDEVFDSAWIYPCFIFAVIAMFKYIPTEDLRLPELGVSWSHVVHIIVSLSCNDIPFIIIRMSTMIIYHTFLISDMIFIFKNWFVIIFSCIQLGIVFYNRNRPFTDSFPKKRKYRGPDVWCDPKDDVCHVRVGAMEDKNA